MTDQKLEAVKELVKKARSLEPRNPQWKKIAQDFEAFTGREMLTGDLDDGSWPKRSLLSYLQEVKTRNGRWHPANMLPEDVIKELVQRGLAAGDHSRLYLTDKGEEFLGSPQKALFMEELRSIPK